MRKPIIAGNWKMYKNEDEAVKFAYEVADAMPSVELVDSVICAPFISLKSLVKCLKRITNNKKLKTTKFF